MVQGSLGRQRVGMRFAPVGHLCGPGRLQLGLGLVQSPLPDQCPAEVGLCLECRRVVGADHPATDRQHVAVDCFGLPGFSESQQDVGQISIKFGG